MLGHQAAERFLRRRSSHRRVYSSVALAAAALAAAVGCLGHAAFVLAGTSSRHDFAASSSSAQARTIRRAKKNSNPLVFKMPRRRAEREIQDEDDEFTVRMRKRLDELKASGLKPDLPDATSDALGVRGDKINDHINKESVEAQMDMRTALWRMDRANDELREDRDNPDLDVMKARFMVQKDKLEARKGGGKQVEEKEEVVELKKTGMVNLAGAQDFDSLLDERDAADLGERLTAKKEKEKIEMDEAEMAAYEKDKQENIAYLQMLQEKSNTEARLRGEKASRRVRRSPQERKDEYESSKTMMFASTASIGVVGSITGNLLFGSGVGFAFALGSAAAVQYLTGLAGYTDNAENPIGGAVGGRRFLAPVLLILIIQLWPNFEANYPAIAALHLDPSLLAGLFGFFTYNLGTVAGRAFPRVFLDEKKQSRETAFDKNKKEES